MTLALTLTLTLYGSDRVGLAGDEKLHRSGYPDEADAVSCSEDLTKVEKKRGRIGQR
jgi:hypothetical protein